MPPRSLVRAFFVLYGTLGVVVLVQSVETILAAHRGAVAAPDKLHAIILGTVETAAAVVFLVRERCD